MTKKIFGTMAVVIAMFVGYNIYNVQNERELTGASLSNIEALAKAEVIIGPWYCVGDVNICYIDAQGVIFGQKFYF